MSEFKLDFAAKEFVSLVSSGKDSAALIKLRNEVGMEQALYACDQLSPGAIDWLLQKCAPGLDGRNAFVLELVRDLVMPSLKVPGGLGFDLDEARKFLLLKLVNPKTRTRLKVQYPQAAYEYAFYPEYKLLDDKRQRVTLMAQNHVNLKKNMDRQINLFSLGGCFNWDQARALTNLDGSPGTTCGLFVRGILFACGCKANDTWNTCSTSIAGYIGLDKNPSARRDYSDADPPEEGDIFWLGGGQFAKTTTYNDHTGIVLKADGRHWRTAEGGQNKTETHEKKREVVQDTNGRYRFKDDMENQGSLGYREIKGIVNIKNYPWRF